MTHVTYVCYFLELYDQSVIDISCITVFSDVFTWFLGSAALRCIFTGVYMARFHGGYPWTAEMLSFHHLVWKNLEHLKHENNIHYSNSVRSPDLVKKSVKLWKIQSLIESRMTRYQEVVMILIGSMAIRVSNEDGSRKFAPGPRVSTPPWVAGPFPDRRSCELFWGKDGTNKVMLLLYDIPGYPPTCTSSKHTPSQFWVHDFTFFSHWWDVLICLEVLLRYPWCRFVSQKVQHGVTLG